nr:MAG TPA: hypothetical protein [Caudoviricetes sp.]
MKREKNINRQDKEKLFAALQECRRCACRLRRRIDRIERELSGNSQPQSGSVCTHAQCEGSVPHGRRHSFQHPRRDSNKKGYGYKTRLVESDALQCFVRRTEPSQSQTSWWLAVLDEL